MSRQRAFIFDLLKGESTIRPLHILLQLLQFPNLCCCNICEAKNLGFLCPFDCILIVLLSFLLGDNSQGCLGDNYCPPECTCTGTVVRCSHAKLKEIPNGIPRETSELYLDVNEITAIDTNRLKHLKALTRL